MRFRRDRDRDRSLERTALAASGGIAAITDADAEPGDSDANVEERRTSHSRSMSSMEIDELGGTVQRKGGSVHDLHNQRNADACKRVLHALR